MPNSKMPLFLSTEPAEGRWGKQALLSANNQGITIHLPASATHAAVQQAGRRLDNEGVRYVELTGPGWDLAYCWAFWQGFRTAQQAQQVIWPALIPEEQQELTYRLDIIDWMRDLINLAPADLSPKQLAQQAITLLQRFDKKAIQYRLITGEALQTEGYHGLYAVGCGSVRAPALLALDYNPSGNSSAPVLACLVGKGITFDSGGYSLKSAEAMEGMKGDMGGAALVTASLALAMARGLQHRVKLYLCCADNLVSGSAYKVGDIIHYRNGKSVEVMNTDAEGRLVLADGLIEASAQKAKYLIDCATLTGSAKIALGNDYHGLFSFDDSLAAQFLATAAEQNEPFWRLPLAELHRQQLPSPFADLGNISTAPYSAGASTAAAFLSHFVTPYQQGWLHIDCAANYRKKTVKQWAAGATGLGVLTLSALLSKLASVPAS